MKDNLTIEECAEECGVTRNTFYKWIAARKLSVIRYSQRQIRVKRAALDEFQQSRTVNAVRSVRR